MEINGEIYGIPSYSYEGNGLYYVFNFPTVPSGFSPVLFRKWGGTNGGGKRRGRNDKAWGRICAAQPGIEAYPQVHPEAEQ